MAFHAYAVLGSPEDPRILFYHEIVNPKSGGRDQADFKELHTQEYYEFNFFIAGKRSIKVGTEIYDFKAGDVLLASPEEAHGGSLTHGVLDRYRLHIFPKALESFPEGHGLQGIFERKKNTSNRLTLNEEQQKTVYHYLSDIDNSIKLGHPSTKNIIAYADILKLLAYLCNLIEHRETVALPKNKMLLDILSFIESSYDSVTVGEIEAQFNLGHATLWRLFSRELATSPSAYILDIRLKKAKMMLSQGFDVQTVSDECGFCDCSYFIKKFKKKYGSTPYRLKLEKENLL